MNKLTLAILAASVSTIALGCDTKKPVVSGADTGSSVAVVNLDHIAQQMGWAEEMQKNLDDTKNSVGKQISDAMQPAINAANKKRDDIIVEAKLKPEYADELKKPNTNHTKEDLKRMGLSDKEIEELGQAYGIVAGEVNSAQQQLNQVLEQQKGKVLHAFGMAVQPVVRKVAKDNNKTVVLIAGPTLLYSDSAADISDKVIDDMQHSSTPTHPEWPKIPTPEVTAPQLPPAPSSSATPAPAPAAAPVTPPAPIVKPHTAPPTTPTTKPTAE